MQTNKNLKERKIPKSNLFRGTFYFNSVKNAATMFCDSKSEVHGLNYLEFLPEVTRFMSQPKSFQYIINGKRRRYTADVFVEHCDSINKPFQYSFIEMKTHDETTNSDFLSKYEYLRELFENHQKVGFELLDYQKVFENDDHIRRACLKRYLRSAQAREVPSEIGIDLMTSLPSATIKQVTDKYQKYGYSAVDGWAFIATHFHKLKFHGDANLTRNTELSWSH